MESFVSTTEMMEFMKSLQQSFQTVMSNFDLEQVHIVQQLIWKKNHKKYLNGFTRYFSIRDAEVVF